MREPVVGIDLGTTFSAVAAVVDGKPIIIPSRVGGRLTPSMVGFTPGDERVVGATAFGLSEEHPERVAYATKRFIGRRFSQQLADDARSVVPYALVEGPSGEIRVKLGDKVLPITQVSAMVLGELKLDAQAYFGRDVTKCVITVPANFDDAQRQATREAARIAGLEVVRIVNEPTAAAVAYGLQAGFRGRALVFDLGGGTFDVSILDVQDGVFEVKATGGDGHLGGEDFDNRIVQWLLAQIPDPFREPAAKDRLSMQRLKVAAERAKRQLTDAEEALITVDGVGDNIGKHTTSLETALTRAFFETLSDPLSRRCLKVCEQVMADAGLAVGELDSVLLVGGMTRVPLVRKLVTDFFQRGPVTGINPDEAVALGAAIHAAEIGSKESAALLLDVVSQSLGVGLVGGKVKRIIPKNTVVPVSATEGFFPGQSGQKEARIRVFQGESEYADENRMLGEVLLKALPGGHRNDAPLDVTFELSGEGMLTVKVVNLVTGMSEVINVRARTELSKNELQTLKTEQQQYEEVQQTKDLDKLHAFFTRLLDKAERLAAMLVVSAEENPSDAAHAAVANVRALVDSGKAAMKTKDNEAMANVTRKLTALLQGAPS